VLFTPRLADSRTAGRTDAAALAAELERAIADGTGVRARTQVLGRTVYLHTPDGYPRSELRRVLKQSGRTDLRPSGRNGAQLGDGQQPGRALRTLTCRRTFRQVTRARLVRRPRPGRRIHPARP
jgi:hypothetical protein